MSAREEQAAATRDALMAAARELFEKRGYGGVGTEEIVRRAGVTRGALYHHFSDKRDLFRAVHEELEQEIVAAIGATMTEVEDPRALMEAGLRAFLDACTDPAMIRISLLDAPTVLGWAEWREIDERYGLGLVSYGLQNLLGESAEDVRPLAHLVLGALGEAAMLIANADDPAAARRDVEPALLGLLDGVRA
jgi:AcrR family transcriptional regulator